MDMLKDVLDKSWGEINAPADYLLLQWPLPESAYYRVFFHARNGSWNQDLILRRSEAAQCWLAATRVLDKHGRDVAFRRGPEPRPATSILRPVRAARMCASSRGGEPPWRSPRMGNRLTFQVP
jgi:hypothetical protein